MIKTGATAVLSGCFFSVLRLHHRRNVFIHLQRDSYLLDRDVPPANSHCKKQKNQVDLQPFGTVMSCQAVDHWLSPPAPW